MKNVNHTHPDYDRMAIKWKRCRDVIAGQDAIHTAGEAYLRRLKDQTDEDYAAYVERAGFYNATWRTMAALMGMMFRKPPHVELPGNVATFANDIDLAGTHIDTFARKVAVEVLGLGRVAVLVDVPDMAANAPATLAEAERAGLRPMLKTYPAETLINWKYERVNNRHVLTFAVLTEMAEVPEDEFKSGAVQRWRVLDLVGGTYRQRVFQKAENGKDFEQVGPDIFPLRNGETLDFVPLFIVGVDGIDSTVDEPPLIDLVDLNLSHYRSNADYEHGCHFTGLPTAVVSGYVGDGMGQQSLYIGSQAAWVFPDPQAKAQYLEFTGQGLGALERALDRKEAQMAILGARMIAEERRVAETATTASIHRSGENSVLANLALAVSDAMEKALAVFAQWSNVAGAPVYQINRDYSPAMLDASQITALLKAVQMGQISGQSLHELLQRADLLDSAVTFEEEQERVSSAALPAPVREVAA